MSLGLLWPGRRTACVLAGLLLLVVDLYSGIGAEADVRLSTHMLEHMIMWLAAAVTAARLAAHSSWR